MSADSLLEISKGLRRFEAERPKPRLYSYKKVKVAEYVQQKGTNILPSLSQREKEALGVGNATKIVKVFVSNLKTYQQVLEGKVSEISLGPGTESMPSKSRYSGYPR